MRSPEIVCCGEMAEWLWRCTQVSTILVICKMIYLQYRKMRGFESHSPQFTIVFFFFSFFNFLQRPALSSAMLF